MDGPAGAPGARSTGGATVRPTTGPLPLYVVALVLCGITTGMGYALGQVAVQNVLPPERWRRCCWWRA